MTIPSVILDLSKKQEDKRQLWKILFFEAICQLYLGGVVESRTQNELCGHYGVLGKGSLHRSCWHIWICL